MTLRRTVIVPTSLLLALAGGGVHASAQETTQALTCVGTETGDEIHFETRWGPEDVWKVGTVQPGDWANLAWNYDQPGQNSSPPLQIRFDADMTDGTDYVTADLTSYAASAEDCEGQGMTYDFYLDGDTLVLVGEDDAPLAGRKPSPGRHAGFSVTFVPPGSEDATLVHDMIAADGTVATDVQMLNELLELPAPVTITFVHSGDGSFYDPDSKEIQVDYGELLEEWKMFVESRPDAPIEELAQALVNTAEFALFHEVGHALIDLLELPVLGKEEDAVDSLATVITLDILEDADAAITGADMWRLRAESSGPIDEAQLAGEHSLDAQRYATMKCLIYGSDPDNLSHIVEEVGFDESRADICQEEYDTALRSWQTVLEPHLR